MANTSFKRITSIGLVLVVAVCRRYLLWRPRQTAPIIGVVRTTEIRIAPEVGGQLAAIKVKKATSSAPATSSPNCPRSS
jgi:HlyD family secretion protein